MREEINPATQVPSRILVVRVGALGDTLMVTPLLRVLRSRRPNCEVDLLCSDLAAPLLELNPHLSRLFRLRGRNLPLALSLEKRRLVRHLRGRKYDLAVLLESASRYRILLRHAGLSSITSFHEEPFDPALHAIVNNLKVGGVQEPAAGDLDMDMPLSTGDEASADSILKDIPHPRIGVHIGWGPQGRKRDQAQRLRGWDLGCFAELIRKLLTQSGLNVALTGSSEDERDIRNLCTYVHDRRVHSIAGRTGVRELAAVIKKMDLLISVDSGPCHMAAAVGTPVVVLWGPGRLEQTRPISSFTPIRIVRHPVPCAPCQSTPLQKTCRRNVCMESITPEEVYEEARNLLPILIQ